MDGNRYQNSLVRSIGTSRAGQPITGLVNLGKPSNGSIANVRQRLACAALANDCGNWLRGRTACAYERSRESIKVAGANPSFYPLTICGGRPPNSA